KLLSTFRCEFYGDAAEHAKVDGAASTGAAEAVPREILVQTGPDDAEEVAGFLQGIRGSAVDVRVPQRGDKKALLETVHRNAVEALAHDKLKRSGDLTARSHALEGLRDALAMAEAPL